MVTMEYIPPVQYGLFIPDKPDIQKQFNTPWEPTYHFYTPKEINESTLDIVIQELINQKIIFEALHYFSIAGLGCGRTA